MNPFYLWPPEWALYPMIGQATAANVIAAQVVYRNDGLNVR